MGAEVRVGVEGVKLREGIGVGVAVVVVVVVVGRGSEGVKVEEGIKGMA
jgi:hypothetical protein